MQAHHKRFIFMPLFWLIFYFFSGCGLFPTEEEVLAPPLVEPEQITYRTAEATLGYIEDSIQKTAYFVPVVNKNHYFIHRGGRIKEIYVKSGDAVKKGDILASLLTDGIEKEIEYQRLLVDSQIKDISYIQKLSEIDIQSAKDNLAALEKKYRDMEQNAGVYTAESIDNIKKEYGTQKISIEKLELNYANQLDKKSNDLVLAQLKLSQLELELAQCNLYAEVDGIVTFLIKVNEGDTVDIYQTLVTIADPKVLFLEYQGTSSSEFKLGMKVEILFKKESYSGEVVFTPSSAPYEELERYKDIVRIKMDKLPEGVNKGDSVMVKLIRECSENAVIIPKRALKTYLGKDVVYVLEDGIRLERYVQKGVTSISEVEITEGLKAGEQVIIE